MEWHHVTIRLIYKREILCCEQCRIDRCPSCDKTAHLHISDHIRVYQDEDPTCRQRLESFQLVDTRVQLLTADSLESYAGNILLSLHVIDQ
jgi:hypothetical protein